MQIWKFFKRFGFLKKYHQFESYYNSGWIIIGKENNFESANKSMVDLSLHFNQFVWKDDLRTEGLCLIQFREEFGIIKLLRSPNNIFR